MPLKIFLYGIFSMFRLSGSSGLIIEVLSSEFPLSTKEIHDRLKRNFAVDMTYQATHKKVFELLSQGVLEKNEKKYQLARNWISDGKSFFGRIGDFYNKKIVSSFIPKENETLTHTFLTPLDLGRFVITFVLDFPNPGNKPVVFLFRSYYPTFSLSDNDYKRMREGIKKNKFYILSHNRTPVDLIIEKEYAQLGAKVKSGIDVPLNPDTLVVGDYVCLAYFPQKFKIDWERYCNSSKGGKIISFAKLFSHLFDTKGNFHIVLTRNPNLADQIRKESFEHFR